MQKEIGWLLKEKHNNKPTKQFLKDIERLKQGEPLDYVIGFTEFFGCKIDLSKKPLIPRPETEFWVEKAISEITPWRNFCHGPIILDIFSGSGCIGIAVLKHVKNLNVDFADIEENNLEQIKINLKINCIKPSKYRIIKSDVFNVINPSSPRLLRAKYDFVFANPPYIATILRNRIQKSVLKYEPQKALFGGKDGLFYIKKFLKEAGRYLNPDGIIFMEFSPEQKKEIEKLILKYKYRNYKFYKDQNNKWRQVNIGN